MKENGEGGQTGLFRHAPGQNQEQAENLPRQRYYHAESHIKTPRHSLHWKIRHLGKSKMADNKTRITIHYSSQLFQTTLKFTPYVPQGIQKLWGKFQIFILIFECGEDHFMSGGCRRSRCVFILVQTLGVNIS